MFFSNRIRLFWWNEVILQSKSKENYGDLLGKYLVEKISGKRVNFARPQKFSVLDFCAPIYVTIGSILTNVNYKCIVWGSGVISADSVVKKATFLAVRGPRTRDVLIDKGYDVPEVYGDPALLLPRYFNPIVEKKYALGVIPHYTDFKIVNEFFKNHPQVKIIDMMTDDVESKTIEFLECERIISSSLHGVILSHTFGIPAVWQKFSDKVFGDDIKYQDYFESVQLTPYIPELKQDTYTQQNIENLFSELPSLPSKQQIDLLCDGLMEVCPFKKSN